MPTAPHTPAASPTANAWASKSPVAAVATASSTSPASCETTSTGASVSRRVYTPPRKSAVPQTMLEPSARATASMR